MFPLDDAYIIPPLPLFTRTWTLTLSDPIQYTTSYKEAQPSTIIRETRNSINRKTNIKRAGKWCQRKCGNETKCLQTVIATLKRRYQQKWNSNVYNNASRKFRTRWHKTKPPSNDDTGNDNTSKRNTPANNDDAKTPEKRRNNEKRTRLVRKRNNVEKKVVSHKPKSPSNDNATRNHDTGNDDTN